LPFSKGTVFHPFKIAAMKEEVLFILCFDEAKSPVCN